MSDDSSPFAPPTATPIDLSDPHYDLDLVGLPSHVSRFVAYMLDVFLVLLPTMPLVFAFVLPAMMLEWDQGLDQAQRELVENTFITGVAVVSTTLYHALFESSRWQATPGKMLLGLKVVRDDGGRLSVGQALFRGFARSMLLQLCGIIALGVFFDELRRGPWGTISKSRVIEVDYGLQS